MSEKLKHVKTRFKDVEYKDGVLSLYFEDDVPKKWFEIFKDGKFNHGFSMRHNISEWGSIPFPNIPQAITGITCRAVEKSNANKVIYYAQSWLPEVDKLYNEYVDRYNNTLDEIETKKKAKETEDKAFNEELKKLLK